MGPAEKGQDRKNNSTKQKNKRGGRKVESNDSPELRFQTGQDMTSPTSLQGTDFEKNIRSKYVEVSPYIKN